MKIDGSVCIGEESIRQRGFTFLSPSMDSVFTAKEGQVTVTDFAMRKCNLCHSCQPFWLEKVSSPDMGGSVTSYVHEGIPSTPGTETQQHPALPSCPSLWAAEKVSEKKQNCVCRRAVWFLFIRRFLGTQSVTLCHIGRARILRDFMAVGVMTVTYST